MHILIPMCALEQSGKAWQVSMELNVREENLRNLFKQFQVEHNENCKTVFIDNNDEDLENYLNESNTVYLHMVDYEIKHLDLSKVNTIFVIKSMRVNQKMEFRMNKEFQNYS